jgi:sodium/proline symporter
MAIRSASDTKSAAFIGVSWAFTCYLLAIIVGLSGLAFLPEVLVDSERVFIAITGIIFHPLIAGILLAAILAAIMSTVDSQLLVCSSSLSEDLYPLVAENELSPERRVQIGRFAVAVLAICATMLAMQPDSKVLDIVSYAWAGLGASIGPTLLMSLYWKHMSRAGALAGILTGGLTVILWSQFDGGVFDIYSLVPGFCFSIIAILLVSVFDGSQRDSDVLANFEKMQQRAKV